MGDKLRQCVFVLNISLSRVFRKAVLLAEMNRFTCVTSFFFFFFVFFLTHYVGAHLWSAPFQMDVSHQNPDYLTEDSTARFSGLNQCNTGTTVAGSWVAFWISEHKMAHLHFVDYQCPSNSVLLFYHLQKASQVYRMLDDHVIYGVLFACVNVFNI